MDGEHPSPLDPEGDDLVPLSALNALLYCDRRAALRHLDGLFIHNEHTRRGEQLHARADRAGVERRRGLRTERGLWLASRRLRLYGRADLVEFERSAGPRVRGRPVVEVPAPVEYKRGRLRRWDNDDVQLCAQALCLEEMLGVAVPRGAVFHARSKTRRTVEFDSELREKTEEAVRRLHALLASGRVPPAVLKPRCRGCSLRAVCLPEVFSHAHRVATLVANLFNASLSDPSRNA